jgi:hypothetical protein
MVEQALKNAIPNQLSSVRKFTEGHDPYHFASWENYDGSSILRYWFWDKTNTKQKKKRNFLNEVAELLEYLLLAKGKIRQDFDMCFP